MTTPSYPVGSGPRETHQNIPANRLWGAEYGDLYDWEKKPDGGWEMFASCTLAGVRTECPGWRYLTLLEGCPRELVLPVHPRDLLERAPPIGSACNGIVAGYGD